MPQIWIDFVDYHTSRDFFTEVVNLFGDSIRRFYPTLESRIGNLDLLETGMRFSEQTDCKPLSLDCQVGIITPGTTTSVVIADDSLLKKQLTIPSAANTLVMFINTIDSVHGVTPRSPSRVSRRLVNIIGEVYNPIPEGLYHRPQVAPGMPGSKEALPLQWLRKVKSKLRVGK